MYGYSGQLECNSVFSGLGSDFSVGRMVRREGVWAICVCISIPSLICGVPFVY